MIDRNRDFDGIMTGVHFNNEMSFPDGGNPSSTVTEHWYISGIKKEYAESTPECGSIQSTQKMETDMQAERGASIHLDIPFYRQHYDFTCGPASLMMAMKFMDNDMRLGKDLEIDLWRGGNLVAVRGTSRYGLAYSAAVRGFSARVTSNTGGIDFVEKFVPPPDDPDMELLKDQFYERRTRCRKLGVRERLETITGRTICKSLFLNHVPLIVTNTLFYSKEDLPHWVAVTGIDDKFMYFNSPADAKPRTRKIGLPALELFVGYHGDQSMVEVWRQ